MAKKQKPKKQRMKIQRPQVKKRSAGMTVVDYIIWTVGGIAAVVVAVWGGYYLGMQSDEEGLSPAIDAILLKVTLLQDQGKLDDAERILNLAMKKYPEEENLYVAQAEVNIKQGKLEAADQLIHKNVSTLTLRYKSLHDLREAYRVEKRDADSIRLSKELAAIDAEIAAAAAEPTPTAQEETSVDENSQQ